MHRLTKPFWLLLAAAFLVEAWLWDRFRGLGRWLAARLPFQPLKAVIARLVERLPPLATLPVFIVPLAVIFPFKIGALWLIARGHFLLGALVFVVAKIVGLGVTAFLFDLCRDKLLSFVWFAHLSHWLSRLRTLADELIAPYKHKLRDGIARLRGWSNGRNRRGFWATIVHVRRYARQAASRR